MIQIQNIEVSAGDVDIIKWVSLDFEPGKNYCLLGKNGSGKSTLKNIPEIKGVKLSEYLRTIFNISSKNNNEEFTELSPFMFKRFIKSHLAELQIEEAFLDRDLNVGFSGGEKRKIEILQMRLIWPKYIILDEIDSGLDLDAFKTVATMLQSLSSSENSIIIITHYFTILDYIDVDKVFVMKAGEVMKEGWKELVEEIKENGFGEM